MIYLFLCFFITCKLIKLCDSFTVKHEISKKLRIINCFCWCEKDIFCHPLKRKKQIVYCFCLVHVGAWGKLKRGPNLNYLKS